MSYAADDYADDYFYIEDEPTETDPGDSPEDSER